MTSFYMFRLWFLTFFGDYRGPNPQTAGHGHDADTQHAGHTGAVHFDAKDEHAAGGSHGNGTPHESPWVMVVPLVILALLSLVGGWVGVPKALHGSDEIGRFLSPVFQPTVSPTPEASVLPGETPAHEENPSTELAFTFISVGVAALGFLGAWFLYYKRPDLPVRMAQAAGGVYRLVVDKYKIDELYGAVFIHPLIALSSTVFWKGIDRGLIDGAVDGSATGAQEVSDEMRQMQSGNIRSYAGWVAIGAAAVIAFMVWRGLR